ncbi:uncharacterized protein LOC135499051 isoform X2 [Lineus longissimus]|uniref:uncharacterized protein LOC135499051 isoform X2 n=1 Tax=Lineus longissimus TaxID=88925 RepID=UPI002B4DE2CB
MGDRQCDFPALPVDKRLININFPTTPNNSLTSTPSGLEPNHELPSFNNAETVRKIQEKKRKLENYGFENSDNDLSFPFTPQNSTVDSPFESFAREHNLPSFCNAEMVDKVRVKRKSLDMLREEGVAQLSMEEGHTDNMEDAFGFDPFTPSNSVSDHKFDKFAKEVNLPSMRNSETVKQIREKREKLKQNVLQNAGFPSEEGEGLLIDLSADAEPVMGDHNPLTYEGARDEFNKSGDFYDFEKSADFTPFTPQNSASGQMFDHFAQEHDLPSFNSAAMVEKICKKKNSLRKEPCASNAINLLKSVPFTPQNSYTNLGSFAPLPQTDKYLSEGFMFDPDELVSRVAAKRKMSECLDLDAIDNGNSCSSTDEEVMFAFQGDLPGQAALGELEKDTHSSASSGSASLSGYENFMCGVSSSDEGLSRHICGDTGASNMKEFDIGNNFIKGILESAVDIVRKDLSKPVIDNVVGQSEGLVPVDSVSQSCGASVVHDSSASSGSASLSAYENFMCGVSSSDEGLSRHVGGDTGACNMKELEIAHNFVEGILKTAIDIVRSDQSKPVIDSVVSQSQGQIQVDPMGIALVDQLGSSDDIYESEPLLDTITNMDQSESPRHDSNSKKAGFSLTSTRVRFSVDDEELSKDAYSDMIADEIAGDSDAVVPIGGILQINHEDTWEQKMFTHNWDGDSSNDSSDSEGHVGSYDVNAIKQNGGSYDIDALNQDVVKNVAQTFVDDIIKDACDKYQNEAQEAALKKVADEFVAGVLKSAADAYVQSCDEAAEEFCVELIRQALDEFSAPDKNDASDDTGIFEASDGFISPAGERLGKLSSVDSEISNGYRKGTPKSLSLDSPLQFSRQENIDSEGNNSAKRLKKNLSEPTPGFGRRMSDLDIETEYLCSYDPLFGNMEIVSSPDHSFSTDATRDIAENESFKRMRKESGIFDDSDGEDMDSLKKFLELRAMQEHFAEKDDSPSGVESVNYNVPPGAARNSAPAGGSSKNFNYKVPSGGNSVNFQVPLEKSSVNFCNQNNDGDNCNSYGPNLCRHSDTGPAGRSSRPSAGSNRTVCTAHDSGIDPGTEYVNATSGGRGSNTWGRGDPAWDVGSHGVVETCDIDRCESDRIKQGVFDGDKFGLGEVGKNGVRLERRDLDGSPRISQTDSGVKWSKHDQTWISRFDVTATETDALLDNTDHYFPETEKPERHFGVNSAVSDADAFEDLSEREDSEVFLDDSAAALLGSAAGSRRSSAKFSASSVRTWSSLGSRSSKSDYGSTSDPGVTFGDYVRDLFIHVRRHNGEIVVLRKTFLQDKMSRLGIKMEKASQKEIFYTTAGRISIQVDSFPEFLEDGTRVIDEDGFVQLLGGRYEISQDLLDSADRLCKKIDEVKENEQRMKEGGSLTGVDDDLQASSTPIKAPDVVHDTEGSDGEDNNNESKKFSRPSTLETSGSFRRKIRVKNMEELDFRNERFPSFGEADAMSNDNVDLDKTFDPDDIQTPDELDTPDLEALGVTDSEFEDDDESTTPEGDSDNAIEPIPEYTATEEFQESRNWRKVTIAEKTYKIDMKVIEPYKKVLSHGGHYGNGLNAIIIFASCYLPDKGRTDYNYVMDNLFLYVISTLELLVAEDYMIVYFHGSTPRTRMPTIGWMRRCYQIIDRRLRKNLKGLLLVHPTFWLKTVILMTRPFISTKFSSKVKFIHSLKELGQAIPMEYVFVPDQVKRYDALMRKQRAISSSASSPATPVSSR